MLGAHVLPNDYSTVYSMTYPTFHAFQPVRHFLGSQCLVLAYAIVIYSALLDVLSHPLNITIITTLNYNEIKLGTS